MTDQQQQPLRFPTLNEVYRASRQTHDEQRLARERQLRESPFFWEGQGMTRPMSYDEKYKRINGVPPPKEQKG